jgi:hypothetical protein
MMEDVGDEAEFAEVDTSEDELDAMMAAGQPVVVVTTRLLAEGSALDVRPVFVAAPPATGGAATTSTYFAVFGSGSQTISGAVEQMAGVGLP